MDSATACRECGTSFVPETKTPSVPSPGLAARAAEAGAEVVHRHGAIIKRMLCLLGGICWLLIGLGFGLFLVEYLFQGAGIHIFGLSISSLSVLLGTVHVVGLALATLFSFALGIWLAACGMTKGNEQREAG